MMRNIQIRILNSYADRREISRPVKSVHGARI